MPAKHDGAIVESACLLYKLGKTGSQVAAQTGVSRPVLYRELKKRNIPNHWQTKGRRIYKLDEYAFDRSSEERDYWVGMMMADGCVYKSKSLFYISLGLKSSDDAHIEKFRKFLKAGHPVRYKNTMAQISISSHYLSQSLHKFGVTEKKTFSAKVNLLEDSPHFWRGVIDGDGSIFIHGGDNLPTISLVGSKYLLEQFLNYVRTIVPLYKGSLHPKQNIFHVAVGGRYAVPVIETLYGDCNIALDRKKQIADAILEQNFRPFDEYRYAKKMTTKDVIKMREMYATGQYSCYALNKIFGFKNAWEIITRKTWKHI